MERDGLKEQSSKGIRIVSVQGNYVSKSVNHLLYPILNVSYKLLSYAWRERNVMLIDSARIIMLANAVGIKQGNLLRLFLRLTGGKSSCKFLRENQYHSVQ